MLPRVDAREIGRLNDAGALVAAVQISRANGSRHRIAVEHLTGVDGVVFVSACVINKSIQSKYYNITYHINYYNFFKI